MATKNNKKEMLLNFYEHVLAAMECTVTADGMVSNVETGEPVLLSTGERLVLPTDERLSQLAGSNMVAFHPMSENVILGQSPVMRLVRTLVNQSITHKVLTTMMGIAVAVATGVDLKSAQITKLTTVSDIDDKTVKAITKLSQQIDHNSPQRVVNVFLKHGGMIDDNSFKRTAYVSWPLYDELVSVCNDNGDTVYGVTMRKKDVGIIRNLFELLIPHAAEQDYYSAGSNSKAAPYFHSALTAFANVVGDLNSITWAFRKVIFDAVSQTPHVTLDFIDEFGEGDYYRDIIPALDKNQGERGESTTNDAKVTQNQQQIQQQQVQQPQVQQQQVQQQQVQQPYQHQQQPVYQQQPQGFYQTNQQIPVQQQQSRWNGPTIGASVDSSGGTNQSNTPPNVLQTQQDVMSMAYPPSMYPQMYMQPNMMMQPQYPTFGGNQMVTQPQYQQPNMMVPMQQPQYQQPNMMVPMQQPQYQQPNMMMMMPQQNGMQPQQQSMYPKFNRAK